MKYNLGMVTYVIPMFRYGRMDACEEIVDRMIETLGMIMIWN